ncbi:hypothetical protein AAMO2058_001428300 [Amorphochlora amoebiformis]
MQPIRVAVRIRPQSRKGESKACLYRAPSETPGEAVVVDSKMVRFERVFGPKSSQQDVYFGCGVGLVDSLFQGYNACLFAYGQTGSGKTHSMLGPDGGNKSNKTLNGLIPQITSEIFRRIFAQKVDADRLLGANMSSFELRASYIEVYNGLTYDLLSREQKRKPLQLRQEQSSNTSAISASIPHVHAPDAITIRVDTLKQLMSIIRRGSQNRQTQKTGMNLHSSRSHAILTLTLEHRWRMTNASPSKTTSEKAKQVEAEKSENQDDYTVVSRLSRLLMCDLAGSESTDSAHGGVANRSGCHVNLGLMCLSKVCASLSSRCRDRGAKPSFIPYRDSHLTRLLQSSLGGRSLTWMLACVSPEMDKAWESSRTVEFAKRIRTIQTDGERNDLVLTVIDDPIKGDVRDSDTDLNRRTLWIPTKNYGDIFARAAGFNEDPLILYVHGSGPRNSSLEWNWLVTDLGIRARTNDSLAKAKLPQTFYHVAIDCPGYARSPGDKQTIRSYPHQILREIIDSLGKEKAFCLCGCSQGACAVLNAAVESNSNSSRKRKISEFFAVYHPVGHDVKRYERIQEPTLLVFDTTDKGHPVSVGRLMNRYLQNPHYFEHTPPKQSGWSECLGSKMCDEMIRMFVKHGPSLVKKGVSLVGDKENRPNLSTLSGGFRKWSKADGREWEHFVVDQSEENQLRRKPIASNTSIINSNPSSGSMNSNTFQITSKARGTLQDHPHKQPQPDHPAPHAQDPEWEALIDSKSFLVTYRNLKTKETTTRRPMGVGIKVRESTRRPINQLKAPGHLAASGEVLFEGERDIQQEQNHQRNRQEEGRRLELQQRSCMRCTRSLMSPRRVTACRHVHCAHCAARCLDLHMRCGVCGVDITTSDKKVDLEHQALLANVKSDKNQSQDVSEASFQAESKSEAKKQIPHEPYPEKGSRCLVLEIGNTAEEIGGGKFRQNTYLSAVGGLRMWDGTSSIKKKSIQKGLRCIKKVEWNINPGYDKPTASLSKPNSNSGYTLERTLTFSYPCFATVYFDEKIVFANSKIKPPRPLPPLLIKYATHLKARHSYRIVVAIPPASSLPRRVPRGMKMIFEPEFGEGWLLCGTATQNFKSTYNRMDKGKHVKPKDMRGKTSNDLAR